MVTDWVICKAEVGGTGSDEAKTCLTTAPERSKGNGKVLTDFLPSHRILSI